VPAPSLSRLARLAAAVLAAVVVLLAIAEGVARLAFPVPVTRPVSPHPLFGFVRTPGYHQVRHSLEEPPQTFEFKTNALGFRGKTTDDPKKKPGAYRIFFVGGSTTENQHLDEPKTFPGIVEDQLTARLGGKPPIEVANCGIFGSGVVRSLSLIAHRILELEPDLIVLLDGENDMLASLSPDWDPANAVSQVYPVTLKDLLMDSSRLLGVLDVALSKKDDIDSRATTFLRRRLLAKGLKDNVPKDLDLLRGRPLFLANLRRIALICEDAGVPLVLMTQPTLWKPDLSEAEKDSLWMAALPGPKIKIPPEKCIELMESYNQGIRDVAKQFHLGLVDLATAVPKDLSHFIDDAHLTAEGNKSVADAILATVFAAGLPPRLHPSPY
jgi:lysophospholipase L1-like esterase